MSDRAIKAVIIGAGPAGLTAAYELSKQGQHVVVLESDPQYVAVFRGPWSITAIGLISAATDFSPNRAR